MVNQRGYSHLHVHSEYSILDGIIRIKELIDWTCTHGRGYVSLTDHGNLYGAIAFNKMANDAGLKPIIGVEAYFSPLGRHDRTLSKDEINHLVLYASNLEGYKNIVKMISLAYIEGFYHKPRIDMELLRLHNEGVIISTACLKGFINRKLYAGQIDEAKRHLEELIDIFSKERIFLEYMYHGMPEQKALRPMIESFSDEYKIPIIATNDAHYVKKSDAFFQDVMMCVQMNKKLTDEKRTKFPSEHFYLKTYDEMLRVVEGNSEWLENCDRLAEQVDLKLPVGEFHFPTFETPDGSSPNEYLAKISNEGLRKRFKSESVPDEYITRLNYELDWINQKGFAPYLLIIEDFVRYALSRKINKGPGRGSGAGCLVSYAIGITDVDPIKYKLLFERFINPARKDMPDMDIDFDPDRREEVIKYVREKYSHERVCQIVTFNTLKSRAAIRDSARVLDIDLSFVNKIAKMVPSGMKIDEALEQSEDLRIHYNNDPGVKRWIDTARAIEGLVRSEGVHPAGIVIADKPITEYAPVKIGEGSQDLIAHFSMNDIATIGLIKIDFLGLKTLSYIEDTIKLVKQNKNLELNIETIPLDDKPTYKLLNEADTLGVFQLESSGMRSLMRQIQPDWIGDIIALIALYRPGPMRHAPEYAENKNKKKKIKYPHPDMAPILDETYGVITYQEQITMILVTLAGMALPDAVRIIKIISKKRSREEIQSYLDDFIAGTSKKNISPKVATEIFESITDFAGYGFNKSHSSAYSLLAYWTAYLKANFPIEFYCAFLTSEKDNMEKMSEILGEIRNKNIGILPPDVNYSDTGFIVDDGKVRFGLAAIKGIGEQAVIAILNAREKGGAFKDLVDFTSRVDLHVMNRGVIESLILSGAMDSLPGNRAQKVEALDRCLELAKSVNEDKQKGQEQLFDFAEVSRQDISCAFKDIPDFPDDHKLRTEKNLTGMYLSGHPLLPFWGKIRKVITHNIADVKSLQDWDEVIVGGMVSLVKNFISQKNENYVTFRIEDLSGSVNAMVFSGKLAEIKPHLEEDAVVVISGKVRIDVKESQDGGEDVVETRDAKIFCESAKKLKGPTEKAIIEDIVPQVVKSSLSKDKADNLSFGFDNEYDVKENPILQLRSPLPKNLEEFGANLKEMISKYPGQTPLMVIFTDSSLEFVIDLGEKYKCDHEKVLSDTSKEFKNLFWSLA